MTLNLENLEEILDTVHFPATKQELLEAAREAGADTHTLHLLLKLRGGTFLSPADVNEAVEAIKPA